MRWDLVERCPTYIYSSRDAHRPAVVVHAVQRALMEFGNQMDMFADLDRDFHSSLFEAIGMVSLHELLTDRLGHLYRCQRLELPREGKAQDIVEAHLAILQGIKSGDPERAAAAVRAHLSGTISRVESIRAEHPDYFTDGVLR